jgi:ABC-2 type transport system ATP-binding protein
MTLLRTEQLTKDYGRIRALDHLDLEVAPGEVFGLLGPNGSGKSTALRLLLGFLQPSSGKSWIGGHDCWHDSVNARRNVAYLPGELRLYENMTGRQLVQFLSQLRNRPNRLDRERLAQRFDIDLARPISQLSSGMKRKLALLQVLLPHSHLLILDEPTNTLDPTMRDELLQQLRQAGQAGQAVLFSSHVLSEVERICDRVGILQNGRLVHLQDMAKLREARRVRVIFAHEAPAFPDLPGLGEKESTSKEMVLEYTGPLPPLLVWLGQHEVVDLHVEPLGLAAIYHRFHGNIA